MVALALGGSLLGGQSAQAQDWRQQFPKFRYGVQAVETQAAALTRYKGFGEYVKQKLGVELELFLSAEYAGVIQAIGAKQLEVMDMGASGYAAAWVETKGGVEPLVVPTNPDGTIGYYAVAFVRADSPYKTLDDLKGKTFAWVEPNSSSGYLFPLVGFRKMGLDPEKHFGKVVFSGGHEQGIIGVLDKAYDGAVTWTNDVEKHTRGGLHMMLSRGVLKKEDIRIIWVSELIPNPVIAIRSDVPQQMKADLQGDVPQPAQGQSAGVPRGRARRVAGLSGSQARGLSDRGRSAEPARPGAASQVIAERQRHGCLLPPSRPDARKFGACIARPPTPPSQRFEAEFARLRRRQRIQLFGFAVVFLVIVHAAAEVSNFRLDRLLAGLPQDRRVHRQDAAGDPARHAAWRHRLLVLRLLAMARAAV